MNDYKLIGKNFTPAKERKVFSHANYKCVVALYKEKYQGVARLDKKAIFHVFGSSLEDAEERLINLIENDSLLFEKEKFFCKVIFNGKEYLGIVELYSKEVFRTKGDSLQGTKEILEKHLEEKGEDLVHDHLSKAHQDFLKSKNIKNHKNIGITRSANSRPRTTHCFNCKQGLDNRYDHECNSCGWILCLCGACGCTFMQNQ